MKKHTSLLIALLLVGFVLVSGCTGSGPSTSTTSAPSTSQTSTSSSSPPGTSSSSSPTYSPTTTTTSTPTPSETTTTTPTETTTTTTSSSSPSSTTTSTPTEEAYWRHPWEYAPVEIGGAKYFITYYKYDYKIQPNQSAPVYEYIVEKSVAKTKVSVYGQDFQMNKVDLGEHEVYAYETVVTPVNAASMDGNLKITIWFISNKSEAFLYPWDVLWMSYLSPTVQDKNFVGVKFEYKGKSLILTNPSPFQSGLFPYFEGDQEVFNDISEDLGYLYTGWLATLQFGIWYAWEDKNLLVPQSGVWSDGMHSWEWSTTPDGVKTYGGHTFKLVDFSWKYKGAPEEVSMNGKGKISPYLPLIVQGEGHYSFKDSKTGKETIVYAYLELKDLRLEKVG